MDMITLDEIIAAYKAQFAQIDKEERYKWEAVKCFQDNWDVEADNFAEMLKKSLAKSENLLTSSYYYARGMIQNMADKDPSYVRNMFVNLHDETKDLTERVLDFRKAAGDFIATYKEEEPTWKNHYQDIRAIVAYLVFRYPEKYYFFKSSMFKAFAEKVSYPDVPKQGSIDALISFNKMCDEIHEHIMQDEELLEMSRNRLDENCDPDVEYRMLTMDIVYFGHKYQSQSNNKVSKANFIKWFVPLIKALKDLGGSATPNQVREQIAENEKLSEDILNEVRGKSRHKKFDNEVAWARNYLAYEGFIDKSTRGVWSLTSKGQNIEMTEQLASDIFFKWVDILKERRENNINKAWYVGAYIDNVDCTEEFLAEGIWRNGYTDKFTDMVNSIQVGDRIAIKSTYSRKNNLPFDVDGGSVAVMEIKVIGTVTKNYNDGQTLDVEWDEPFENPKIWYLFISLKTIWEVTRQDDDWAYGALLDFTFKNTPQDYERFLERPYWTEKYFSESESTYAAPYTKEEFLNQVYMEKDMYDSIRGLLMRKHNIILQGAPGVGKTYAAKRLAYSIIGRKDKEKVGFVQFHQNYSYEDFIMGYKPKNDGFELQKGVFYHFCEKAKDNPSEKYFFIIDEINRGNMSKIFGELLMLIEHDYRGESITLAYDKSEFSVPENVYIIGMMNTADRSLAMIDYALRRRFSFVPISPAFDSEGFKEYQNGLENDKLNRLIDKVKELNKEIVDDPTLGDGFQIGHSYFCNQNECSDEWLREIVRYDIIPTLKEYWFDNPEKVDEWSEKLSGVLDD